jgi:uncharacterized protein (TIGR02444 family)
MSGQFETKVLSIWDFALALYGREGVAHDFLVAQDRYRLDVTALIFALYSAYRGQGFDAAHCARVSRHWSGSIVDPLRAARVAIKSPPREVDSVAAEALRSTLKAVELESERLLLNALADLPNSGRPKACYDAIRAMVEAAGVAIDPELKALLKRLALQGENM